MFEMPKLNTFVARFGKKNKKTVTTWWRGTT